jgi:hypothetical protein
MENQSNQSPVETKQSLNPNIAIGIGLNIVSWVFATTVDNHNLIIIGVIGCLIGAFFCFKAKNWVLVFLCVIDAYLLFDLNKDLNKLDNEMKYYEQQINDAQKDAERQQRELERQLENY